MTYEHSSPEHHSKRNRNAVVLREFREVLRDVAHKREVQLHFYYEHQDRPHGVAHNVLVATFEERGLRRIIMSEINPGPEMTAEERALVQPGTEVPDRLEMFVEAHGLGKAHRTTQRKHTAHLADPFPIFDRRVIAGLSLTEVLAFTQHDLHESWRTHSRKRK